MKPHKWGLKLFVLTGVSGFAYNLDATSNIVLCLSRIVHRSQNCKLYIPCKLLHCHTADGSFGQGGIVRRNWLPNCKLRSETSMKKERSKSIEYVTTVDNVDIFSLIWKDNKYVTLILSFAWIQPKTSLKRYDRKLKKTIDSKCPNVIKEYNCHMGGVDLLDSLIARYKIKVKSRKRYIRIFYHLLVLTLVNARLAYKRVLKQNRIQDSYI